ncbi:hypothetical protein O6H91_06G113900 [Diphasiastrum complanatum]|uniref:Uncharacterized protein n=1 Tax=Diphasiastrum complanatum TaxID=34168 RepID=A0ACC2DHR6_DIPCM|nr:hypothetical protein O6H91_06G113900 [Diphasiastrum complanatum]
MSTVFRGNHAHVSYCSQGFALGQLSEQKISARMRLLESPIFPQQRQAQGCWCLKRCGTSEFQVMSGSSSYQKEKDKVQRLKLYRHLSSSMLIIDQQGFDMRLQVARVNEHTFCNAYMFSCEHGTSSEDKTASSKSAISELPPFQQDAHTETKTNQGLTALDTYFSKLKGTKVDGSVNLEEDREAADLQSKSERGAATHVSSSSSMAAHLDNEPKLLQGLKSLDAYFNKLPPSVGQAKDISLQEALDSTTEKREETMSEEEQLLNILKEFEDSFEEGSQTGRTSSFSTKTGQDEKAETSLVWDLRSDSYTVNMFVAMNIAVYLFGLASQQQAFDMGDSSLPFLYGAKVNELILDGEWWRLVTPMFLHSGLLHIGLGSWALLSFGPPVERAYGPLGFCMIYLIGGIFGNLLSFFHTPEGTVGGTGPIYALVGAWVVYLLRNRQVIGKDVASDMIRKVVIMSALNVALGDSLPIDDWTHIGAAFAGALFGALASPVIQLNLHLKELPDSSRDKMESVLLFNESPNPLQLMLAFIVCFGIFFCLYQYGLPNAANELIMLQGDEDLI